MRVPLERKVLNEKDRIAATLRERFQKHGVFCLNLISSFALSCARCSTGA